jgi:hypothetical protein
MVGDDEKLLLFHFISIHLSTAHGCLSCRFDEKRRNAFFIKLARNVHPRRCIATPDSFFFMVLRVHAEVRKVERQNVEKVTEMTFDLFDPS